LVSTGGGYCLEEDAFGVLEAQVVASLVRQWGCYMVPLRVEHQWRLERRGWVEHQQLEVQLPAAAKHWVGSTRRGFVVIVAASSG